MEAFNHEGIIGASGQVGGGFGRRFSLISRYLAKLQRKRIRLDARSGSNDAALENDLDAMAGYIVQHYKNINDALLGLTAWKPNGRPVYPLIVTLEPWWIFNPTIRGALEEQIKLKLAKEEIGEEVLEQMPYTIASIDEAERGFHVLAEIGISEFFGPTVDPERRQWALSPFFRGKFRGATVPSIEEFYREEFMKLFPDEFQKEYVNSLST